MKKKYIYLIVFSIVVFSTLLSGYNIITKEKISFKKIALNDNYAYIDINEILMFILQ